MSVYYDKVAKGYKFHFQYKNKNYKSKKYKTRKKAEMAERRKRAELDGNILLLSQLVEKRLADYEFHDQLQTRAKVEQMYRCRVYPYIEDKDVDQYTIQDIQDMAIRLKNKKPINPYEGTGNIKNQSNYSVNYTVSRLGSIFNWGIRLGYCISNPCINFEKLKYKKPEKAYWTDEDFYKVISILKPSQYKLRARLELFFWTGMRRSEARGLKYSDLDLDHNRLTIRRHIVEDGGHQELPGRKNGVDEMVVLLDDDLVEVLRETMSHDQRIDGFNMDWYVLGYKKPFVLSTFAKQLDRLAELADVPRITPHGFRHSHVSWIYSNTNLTLQETAERIGDKAQTVQNVYAHLYKDNSQKVVDAITESKRKKRTYGGGKDKTK